MVDTALPQSGSGTHSKDYLDGAAADVAFQGLVDRGLFSDQAPTKVAAASPVVAQPTSEPVSSATPEPAAVAAEPAPEPEPEPYASLDDYLTKQSLDRSAFLELPVTVKVDGKETQVPLSSLVKSYQIDEHVTQRSQAVAAKERAWEAEQTQAKQILTQNLTTATQLVQLAHQQLMSEYQGIDWNGLKAADPAQFAVKSLELQQRFQAIQAHLQQVKQLTAQQEQESQQRLATQVEAERTRMLEMFPEWRDATKFQAARTELSSYAKTIGFNEAELAGIADHRYMKVLHDASRYAALQAKSPAVLKMVRTSPPMGAPGARTQRDPTQARYQQARAAMGRNPRNEDAQTAAFSALIDRGI